MYFGQWYISLTQSIAWHMINTQIVCWINEWDLFSGYWERKILNNLSRFIKTRISDYEKSAEEENRE